MTLMKELLASYDCTSTGPVDTSPSATSVAIMRTPLVAVRGSGCSHAPPRPCTRADGLIRRAEARAGVGAKAAARGRHRESMTGMDNTATRVPAESLGRIPDWRPTWIFCFGTGKIRKVYQLLTTC